jgi:hypothetical protein
MPGGKCRVVARHEPSAREPLRVRAGELLTVGREDDEWRGWVWCTTAVGAGGWVPLAFLRANETGVVTLVDYDATELAVEAGEVLAVEQVVNGWLWCRGDSGRSGWVPQRNVEPST